MRQAGLKPKSHNSGVYWIRASATPGGKRESKTPEESNMIENIIAYSIVCAILVWYFVA